jgi:hypothetical protein
MRNRLKILSVSKALTRLRRIKIGEMKVGDTTTFLATEVTVEQKEILRKLGVPPLLFYENVAYKMDGSKLYITDYSG